MQATHIVRRSAGRDDQSIAMNWVINRMKASLRMTLNNH
jgi:hypothetical protein